MLSYNHEIQEENMNREYLEKYADLIVSKGINVPKDGVLVIQADIEAAPLVREVAKKAYEKKAGQVLVNYSDTAVDRLEFEQGDPKRASLAKPGAAAFLNESAEQNAGFLRICGTDPNAFKNADPALVAARQKDLKLKSKPYRDRLDFGHNAWSVVAAPSAAWAKSVYPDLSEEEAIEKLWGDIFEICRVDENDVNENWKKQDALMKHRMNVLNNAKLKKLHYQAGNGTDLWVELPEGYHFEGGSSTLKDGTVIFCNLPTEEVFSAPKKTGVNGTLHATMPLNLSGVTVDDFYFVFKDGKAVEIHAKTGEEALKAQLTSDENAPYLGEIALVPYTSPIRKKDRIFYNTLIDENASCHFAFGQSYAETIENGQDLSEEELIEKGMNQSCIHIDFMVGSQDLSITGYTENEEEFPVFINGDFAPAFDLKQ